MSASDSLRNSAQGTVKEVKHVLEQYAGWILREVLVFGVNYIYLY